ncbi:hypothetical protein UK99_09055 [Frankia casuarinae]|nr:hypothetical protein UK99_09055 [Frankia casuarinae]
MNLLISDRADLVDRGWATRGVAWLVRRMAEGGHTAAQVEVWAERSLPGWWPPAGAVAAPLEGERKRARGGRALEETEVAFTVTTLVAVVTGHRRRLRCLGVGERPGCVRCPCQR